jgi:hypothetical protein
VLSSFGKVNPLIGQFRPNQSKPVLYRNFGLGRLFSRRLRWQTLRGLWRGFNRLGNSDAHISISFPTAKETLWPTSLKAVTRAISAGVRERGVRYGENETPSGFATL